MPSKIFEDGKYTLSGTYFSLDGDLGTIDPDDIHDDVTATINNWKIDFDDPNNGGSIGWDYDYSWGNPGWGFLILGSTSGAYHIVFLGDQKVDWDDVVISYPGRGESSGTGNYFVVTVNGVTVPLTQDESGTAPDRYTPCYLAGSLVDTPLGLTPVEDLSPGDEIFAIRNGRKVAERLVWCGSSSVRVSDKRHKDFSGTPIRIIRDAIEDNIPFVDLVITSEHCICLEEKLIPVRMLVNGISIRYEDMKDYRIYHFKTVEHALVEVNGVLTETLYDDVARSRRFERNFFLSDGPDHAAALDGQPACQLESARDIVEPLFRRISTRCGLDSEAAWSNRIADPEVMLHNASGSITPPARRSDDQLIFQIRRAEARVFLDAEAARPCDVIGPFVDDRRELGLLVSGVTLYSAKSPFPIEIDILDPRLRGWNPSAHGARWTRNRAELILPDIVCGEPVVMAVRIADTIARAH